MQRKRFMIDTNVFIAAFKSGFTDTAKLLLKLLLDPEVELIVDDILLKEYEKWFKILSSRIPKIRRQAYILYYLIKSKARIEYPDEDTISIIKRYFPDKETAYAYHAATCLKTNSILITNDKHFNTLKKTGIIVIWSISEAIKEILNQ